MGTDRLLGRIWRHHPNWYEEFLDVLCEDYPHIVNSLDPEFHGSKYLPNFHCLLRAYHLEVSNMYIYFEISKLCMHFGNS